MNLYQWWRRTPPIKAAGWTAWVILCVVISIAQILPDTLWAYFGLLVPAFIATQAMRAEVTKRQHEIMFTMVSPMMPGAVMLVDAKRMGPLCTAPDCQGEPPHPVHGYKEGS